jgi:uncharacterized protein YbjQ (UPF0145 family)
MSDANFHPVPSASLSGPELYALKSTGYEPIGVVIGVAAISMGSRGFARSIRALFRRGEMTAISQTSAEARRTALARAEQEAKDRGADLVLIHEWDIRDVAEIVEVTCTATALKKCGEFKPMPIATATS